MGSSPSPPPAYNNPGTVIPQSQAANLQTAQEQAALNNVSQFNPMGSSVYTPNGNGGYTLNQTLSPEMQAIFNSITGSANSLGQQAQNMYSNPANINPSAAINQAMSMQEQYLQPYFQQAQNMNNSNLEAQGLNPNDKAYQMSQLQLQQGQQQQMEGALAQFEPQMFQQSLQQYELPAQMLGMMEGEIPGSPSTINTPQTGVPATDVAGIYDQYQAALNQQYQSQMQNYSSMMGGLFGLGGAGIMGGSLLASNPGALAALPLI